MSHPGSPGGGAKSGKIGRFTMTDNVKRNSRAKKRKKGWQALGFDSYQEYLQAKKDGTLEEMIEQKEKERQFKKGNSRVEGKL